MLITSPQSQSRPLRPPPHTPFAAYVMWREEKGRNSLNSPHILLTHNSGQADVTRGNPYCTLLLLAPSLPSYTSSRRFRDRTTVCPVTAQWYCERMILSNLPRLACLLSRMNKKMQAHFSIAMSDMVYKSHYSDETRHGKGKRETSFGEWLETKINIQTGLGIVVRLQNYKILGIYLSWKVTTSLWLDFSVRRCYCYCWSLVLVSVYLRCSIHAVMSCWWWWAIQMEVVHWYPLLLLAGSHLEVVHLSPAAA